MERKKADDAPALCCYQLLDSGVFSMCYTLRGILHGIFDADYEDSKDDIWSKG